MGLDSMDVTITIQDKDIREAISEWLERRGVTTNSVSLTHDAGDYMGCTIYSASCRVIQFVPK